MVPCASGRAFDQLQCLSVVEVEVFDHNRMKPDANNLITLLEDVPFAADENVLAIKKESSFLGFAGLVRKSVVPEADRRRLTPGLPGPVFRRRPLPALPSVISCSLFCASATLLGSGGVTTFFLRSPNRKRSLSTPSNSTAFTAAHRSMRIVGSTTIGSRGSSSAPRPNRGRKFPPRLTGRLLVDRVCSERFVAFAGAADGF